MGGGGEKAKNGYSFSAEAKHNVKEFNIILHAGFLCSAQQTFCRIRFGCCCCLSCAMLFRGVGSRKILMLI